MMTMSEEGVHKVIIDCNHDEVIRLVNPNREEIKFPKGFSLEVEDSSGEIRKIDSLSPLMRRANEIICLAQFYGIDEVMMVVGSVQHINHVDVIREFRKNNIHIIKTEFLN